MSMEIYECGDEERMKKEERPLPIDKRYAGDIFFSMFYYENFQT